jgi:hypothetical protein
MRSGRASWSSGVVSTEAGGRAYIESLRQQLAALFEAHARGWMTPLAARYGARLAERVRDDARQAHAVVVATLPDIGGDANPMTRHLMSCTTSLALYQAMVRLDRTAVEAGRVVYEAVRASVDKMAPDAPPSAAELEQRRVEARESQRRCYPGDWVWEFVEGDGVAFSYGYDFLECGAQKLYHTHDADEYLPFTCFLDFVTYRTAGWGFARASTLAEGGARCDFRFRRGGSTDRRWPAKWALP